ncbi:hypothetical protein D3C81_1999850 [compost metagenome]
MASATAPVTAPVAGLVTGCVRRLLPATRWPWMKWAMDAVEMAAFMEKSLGRR